jgi:hypothetical protein
MKKTDFQLQKIRFRIDAALSICIVPKRWIWISTLVQFRNQYRKDLKHWFEPFYDRTVSLCTYNVVTHLEFDLSERLLLDQHLAGGVGWDRYMTLQLVSCPVGQEDPGHI